MNARQRSGKGAAKVRQRCGKGAAKVRQMCGKSAALAPDLYEFLEFCTKSGLSWASDFARLQQACCRAQGALAFAAPSVCCWNAQRQLYTEWHAPSAHSIGSMDVEVVVEWGVVGWVGGGMGL